MIFEDNDNYLLEVYFEDGCPFVHCRLKRFSLSILKGMRKTLSQLLYELSLKGFPVLFAGFDSADKKNIRYAKFMGLEIEERFDTQILMGISTPELF